LIMKNIYIVGKCEFGLIVNVGEVKSDGEYAREYAALLPLKFLSRYENDPEHYKVHHLV